MNVLACDWDSAIFLVFSKNVFDPLIYYSHLGPLVLSVALAALIFFSNRKELSNRILLFLLGSFCLWSLFDLILWATEKPQYVMFFWSIMIFLDLFMYVASFYFLHVFIYKKDLSLLRKILISCLFLPLIFLVSTKYNLNFFDLTNCEREAREGILWDYTYFVEAIIVFFILIEAVVGFLKTEDKKNRKEIALVATGIVLFLVAFSWGNIIGSVTEDWSIGQYGIFGVPIFIGFLSYSIVKYQTLNIRVLAVQSFVFSISILMGTQFFFIRTNLNRVLTAITLFLVFIFGYMLIRSVKKEIEQKDALEFAYAELRDRNARLMTANDVIYVKNMKLQNANKRVKKERKKLEIANQKIEHQNNQLEAANKKLVQLDHAKTDFVNMASHQLRTPVTSIKGYSSMLLEESFGQISSEQKGMLKNIYDSNERMLSLIEDLLNVSRLESGRMDYEFSKVKIEDICQQVISALVPKAQEKNLTLTYQNPKTPLPELTIDGKKVLEVISNLVDNAIKYTKEGGVNLDLEVCKKSETNCFPTSHIRITVSDTGIGVPKDEVSHIFAKFSRGKDISRLNTGGTGLGLYVGKQLIEGNGGKVWVESEGEGKGSKFIVEIPVKQEEETLRKKRVVLN